MTTMSEAMHTISPEMAAAIVDAQQRARAVGKDAKNTFHGYKYASAEAMIEEARGALSDAGLALMQVGWTLEGERCESAVETKSGRGVIVGRVAVVYRLLHKSGAFVEWVASTPVLPERGRPEDKAEMAALTANLGYVLRGLLLLPREDAESSINQRDDRPREETRREERREAPPPAAADPAFEALCAELVKRIDDAPDLAQFGAINDAIKAAHLPKPLEDRAWSAFFRKGFGFATSTGELDNWADAVVAAKLVEPALSDVREAFNARFDALEKRAA